MEKINFFLLLGSCFLMISGCLSQKTTNTNEQLVEQNIASGTLNSSLPDPSVKKCIDDGYKVEPIIKEGVTQNYMCINSLSHEKCDSWLYYRGECSLTYPLKEKKALTPSKGME